MDFAIFPACPLLAASSSRVTGIPYSARMRFAACSATSVVFPASAALA
jgi:hypothetical protein